MQHARQELGEAARAASVEEAMRRPTVVFAVWLDTTRN